MLKNLQDNIAILAKMLDMILILSEDGKIHYANPTLLSFYGYDLDEIKTKSIYDLRSAESIDAVTFQLTEAQKTGIEFETIHQKKNGETFPVKVRSISFCINENKYLCSVIQDLTAYISYIEKAKIFEVSMDISEESMIVVDNSFKIMTWNKAAEKRLGYTEAELVAQSVDLLIPELKKEEFKVIKEMLQIGQSIEKFETLRQHKDGHLVELSVSYTPIFKKDKSLVGYLAIYNDNYEKKLKYQRTIDFQQRAAKAIEGGSFSIWEYDTETKLLRIFNNIDEILGYHAVDELIPFDKYSSLIQPDDYKKIVETASKQVIATDSLLVEYRIKTLNGNYKWIKCKGLVIQHKSDGSPQILIGTNEDITDTKSFEERLIKKNLMLKKVSEEAKEANEAKSRFLTNVSHEIRTPLNGVITVVQLLKNTNLNLEQKRLITLLENSSLTLKGVISDILDISKIERKQIEVNLAPLSLRDLTLIMFTELQINGNQKGLEISYYFDPKIDFDVVSDTQMLKQILNNLTSNALKYTQKGTISLKTRLVEHKNDKAIVEFEVSDTGIGIDPNFLPDLYNEFSQEDKSNAHVTGGLGLGLSISKHYAQILGSDLSCTSEIGRGSTFILSCPFDTVATSATSQNVPLFDLQNSIVKKANLVANRTILCIEDNMITQNVIEFIAEKLGYKLISAYHQDEAIEALKKNAIDLILMDIQLPKHNGYSIANLIKENEQWRKIPIIAMTAFSRREDREKCLSAGMNEYITKPFDVEHFIALIVQYLA
ncbi:PAS domain S-box protein [Fusibacter bizertensis]